MHATVHLNNCKSSVSVENYSTEIHRPMLLSVDDIIKEIGRTI